MCETVHVRTVSRYQRRMSGPLLDRIDIFVEVPRVEYEKLAAVAAGEPSETVRQRVETARRCQTADAAYRRGRRFIVQK